MPGPGTPIFVDVTASPDRCGGVDFEHQWRFENGQPQGNGAIEVPERSASDPGTPIRFHLNDTTGRQLRFDEADPIWVDRSGCPEEQSDDAEIPPHSIQASGRTLSVLDRNSEKCTLHYALRFRDRDGGYECYDPEIKNGGISN